MAVGLFPCLPPALRSKSCCVRRSKVPVRGAAAPPGPPTGASGASRERLTERPRSGLRIGPRSSQGVLLRRCSRRFQIHGRKWGLR
eukprot:11624686-Alexandrium_andersonii.AAC.1